MRAALAFSLVLGFQAHLAYAFEVEFEGVISIPAPLFLAVDETGRIYVTRKDAAPVVLSHDGELIMAMGDGPGKSKLHDPTGIALFGDKVYIAENGGRVVIFSRDGEYLDSFGKWGSEPKEFMDIRGIAVHGGVIYVADMGNDRVQVFGPNGVYMGSIGTSGKDKLLLKSPTDVAVDRRGLVYAVDGVYRKIKVYEPSGHLKAVVGSVWNPYSIAVGGNGFFVTDTRTASVRKFGLDLKRGPDINPWFMDLDAFSSLGGIAVDKEGRVLVADTFGHRVWVFGQKDYLPDAPEPVPPPTSVKWLRDIGVTAGMISWDAQEGILYAPAGDSVLLMRDNRELRTVKGADWDVAAVDIDKEGALWVLDRATGRLLKLGRDGEVLLSSGRNGGAEGEFSMPTDMVISPKGFIYVADRGNGRVQRLSSQGKFLNIVGKGGTSALVESPAALAVDGEGILYVLDDKKMTVTLYSPYGLPLKEFGGRGTGRGKFKRPVDIAITEDEIFVLDAGLDSVQAFTKTGRYLREFGAGGSGKGDFRNPASIVAADDTTLLVSDPGNARIQVLAILYTPFAPGGLSASEREDGVRLEWNEGDESYVESFRVWRSTEPGGGFEEVASVKTNSYMDRDVVSGVTYYYRVSATAGGGGNESPMSETVTVKAGLSK